MLSRSKFLSLAEAINFDRDRERRRFASPLVRRRESDAADALLQLLLRAPLDRRGRRLDAAAAEEEEVESIVEDLFDRKKKRK